MEQKTKQDEIHIGKNIRTARLMRKMKQTELVRQVQLLGAPITRETLVKIERGIQHIYASQFRAIKTVLDVSYEDLLK